jgi:hypothetical protein
MPRRPGWIDLHDAVDRLSQWALARPVDELATKDAMRIFRKLEALLMEGNIRCVVYLGNEAVSFSVADMLSVPFRIHFEVDRRTPGVEVWKRPDVLSKMSLNEQDFAAAITTRMPNLLIDETASKKPTIDERAEAFRAWLEAEMKSDRRLAKECYRKRAMNAYGLKITTFNELWAALIKSTGCGWDKPGRHRGT